MSKKTLAIILSLCLLFGALPITWAAAATGATNGALDTYNLADGNVVTVTNTASLIQTGQLNWPIMVFGLLGILLVLAGLLMMRKRKHERA